MCTITLPGFTNIYITVPALQQTPDRPVALPKGSPVCEGPCGAVQVCQRFAEDALIPSHPKASVLIAPIGKEYHRRTRRCHSDAAGYLHSGTASLCSPLLVVYGVGCRAELARSGKVALRYLSSLQVCPAAGEKLWGLPYLRQVA